MPTNVKTPRKPASPPDATTENERDEGYGQSHGYGPGHEGPSGPGDAPSKTPATVVPSEDPLENDV
jgi:hypothetical protein